MSVYMMYMMTTTSATATMLLTICMTLFSVTATTTTMLSPSMGQPDCAADDEIYLQNEDFCCKKCAAGWGVALPCTGSGDNNTKCEECVTGKTYSAVHNHIEHCRPCSKCPAEFRVVSPCNKTHNTKCECRHGFYSDGPIGDLPHKCHRCHVCPKGTRVGKMCQAWRNTVCIPCPSGTYSDKEDWIGECRQCSKCDKYTNERVIQQCTPQRDTVCSSDMSKNKGVSSSGIDFIPIYCGLLGLIVLGLIIYVIVKRCNCWAPRKPATKSQTGSESNPLSIVLPLSTRSPVSPIKISIPENDALLKGVRCCDAKLAECDLRQLEKELLVRPGSPTQHRSTATDIWISLAKHLEYTDLDDIGLLAMKEQVEPLRVVLQRWNCDQRASLPQLLQALRLCGRADLLPSTNFQCHNKLLVL